MKLVIFIQKRRILYWKNNQALVLEMSCFAQIRNILDLLS